MTVAVRERWVALIGNPNVGKSTLFNALTGGHARVGNYPGVTVEKAVGTLRGTPHDLPVRLLDLPGTYSLAARSPDEMVAVDVLLGRRADTPKPDAVVVVVDATNLQRNLYLVTQVLEVGAPVVIALNQSDDAARRGITIDAKALGRALGARVVPTVGHKGRGVLELTQAIVDAFDDAPPTSPLTWPQPLLAAEARVAHALPGLTAVEVRRALLDVGGETERRASALTPDAAALLQREREGLTAAGIGTASEVATRYGFLAPLVQRVAPPPATPVVTLSDRIDAVLTHRVLGLLILVVVMTLVFVAMFTWSGPLMDLIEGGVERLGEAARGLAFLGDGLLKELLVDGVIAGVGGVLVFLPQIVILFGVLALLEGCGYMARAAFLMDRVLRGVGLSGRSFLPMLSSFACAIPGVMAARTIESRRDRITTILVAPLMSCSARIPVYTIFIAAFVPAVAVLGFLDLRGLVFAAMYFVGILVAIPVAFLLKRTLLKGDTPSFLVELPPYRLPQAGIVARAMWRSGREFVVRAGTLILAASVVIWALGAFPRHADPEASRLAALTAFDAQEAQAERERVNERIRQEQVLESAVTQPGDVQARLQEAFQQFLAQQAEDRAKVAEAREAAGATGEAHAKAEQQRHSYLGRMGRAVEPVFAPMGWDWKVSMAVIASFPAREVVVGVLGVIYEKDAEEDEEGLREQIREDTWDHGPKKGQKVFDLGAALALMVFFALCAQCASTLVVIRKETGRWAWAGFAFAYMTALAWVGAWLTAVLTRALGG